MKNKIAVIGSICFCLFFASSLLAQEKGDTKNYLALSWGQVALHMPDEWYGSPEALSVAETVMACQQDAGGWQKNKPYHKLTDVEKMAVSAHHADIGATIDNGSTTTEMTFLAKVYSRHKDERYWSAFKKGYDYLLEAQYKNGGWPQFYPARGAGFVSYSSHITYNDNAMVNVMELLKGIADNTSPYAQLPLTKEMKEHAGKAFDKGIACILKTQIVVDGKPTVWCAQHDEVTLLPANARAYELASFSGAESLGIIRLLMQVQQPSREIVTAINGAMAWLDAHKITGFSVTRVPDANGKKNTVIRKDDNALPLLARFYDLQTGKPFFCDRDGIKKSALTEIGDERRNGYSWYNAGLTPLQNEYYKWLQKWNSKA